MLTIKIKEMKKWLLIGTVVCVLTGCETLSTISGYGAPLTEGDAQQGMQGALSQGIATAILSLNKEDGFFGNNFYKILLPADAQKVENTLRKIGLGKQVDKAILQINRSAEDAVGYAKPIFVDAIKEMTIADALSIVKGDNNAATSYFKGKTFTKLTDAFKPSIQQSLDKLEATRYYSDIINIYNKLPTTINKVNPDLTSFVVEKATLALFDQIAQEEANIRANPVARTTEILKKVFASR